jgi:hypothetical protein
MLMLTAGNARAFTANEFSVLCADNSKSGGAEACAYYIAGVADGLSIGHAGANQGISYCVPEGVNSRQIRLIVEKYMRDHPDRLHLDSAVVVTFALWDAFRCKK